MKLSQIARQLELNARAGLATMIWGQPGMGKSEVVMQTAANVAERLGLKGVAEYGDYHSTPQEWFGVHDVRLSQCEPVDVRGLPKEVDGRTAWAVPDWFPSVGRTDLPEYGILFLDEANSAPQSVQAAAYQIANDRRIGDHKMKPGWSIVMAGNRMTDGGVVYKMPLPLCNRLMHLYAEVDFDEWRAWAFSKDIDFTIIAFLGFRPDLLNTFESFVKNKVEGHAFATPRTWVRLSSLKPIVANDSELLLSAIGLVGEATAAEYVAYQRVVDRVPNIDSILLNPLGAPMPDEPEVLFAVSAALASRSKGNMQSLVQYASRMPEEFAMLTTKGAMQRDPKNANDPSFARWVAQHSDLF